MYTKGSFVSVKNKNWGTGKLLNFSKDESKATVGYFVSLASPLIEKIVPMESVEPIILPRNTRAYFQDADNKWFIGRIQDIRKDKYRIHLPDKFECFIPTNYLKIFVRCNKPIKDPIDVLIHKGYETATYHTFRSEFLKRLIRQRGGSRGMPGLLSSRIHLYPHQVEIVRRVLEDPVQRYLLADEVGLGKTIEAGIILRQFLLDYARGNALVITPAHLLYQWREELEGKFFTCGDKERVDLFNMDEVNDIPPEKKYEFLLIDEVQHMASMAFSSDPQQHNIFNIIQRLALSAERLLLLSATPVLNNESDFLAMLHLLDPDNYRLDQIDEFREKVNKRQDIGRLLLSLKEDSHPIVIKSGIRNLRKLFPEDAFLDKLIHSLEANVVNSDFSKELCNNAIREIRVHLSETYRLHRRMLRNRRESVDKHIGISRFDSENPGNIRVFHEDCKSALVIQELLHDWRDAAHASLLNIEGDERIQREKALVELFKVLWEGSGSWNGTLVLMIRVRLKKQPIEAEEQLRERYLKVLRDTPYFHEEEAMLEFMEDNISAPKEGKDRVDLTLEMLKANHGYKKCVIFTAHTTSAIELEKVLSKNFGMNAIAYHLSISPTGFKKENLDKFFNQKKCQMLICDDSAEEGLNLQNAEMVVHFDLPCSPNRLEQRIGRVDRIGRKKPLVTNILAGSDRENCLNGAWFQLLHQGFGVFKRSIASLQFFVDERLSGLMQIAFSQGAPGLLSEINTVAGGIEEEQVKISEQQVLDEIDVLDSRSTSYFDALEKLEFSWEDLRLHSHRWITHALRFIDLEGGSLDPVRYEPSSTTLIPTDRLDEMNKTLNSKGTYNRNKAVGNPEYVLYRIGEPFIDKLYDYLLWDDRGKTFAYWRHHNTWDAKEGNEWFGFRFDYIIEANMSAVGKVLSTYKEGDNKKALLRQADAFFPPFMVTLYLNDRLQEETRKDVLDIIGMPFLKPTIECFNLVKDYAFLIDELVSQSRWEEFCKTAREESENILRKRAEFNEVQRDALEKAASAFKLRLAQLKLRSEREKSGHMIGRDVDLEFESKLCDALMKGIRKPKITLDAVGFAVISGRNPLNESR